MLERVNSNEDLRRLTVARKMTAKSPAQLKGWAAIADFLGQTPSVAQRWHREGMPVETKGRTVYAEPDQLTRWVGTEGGRVKPLHIANEAEDLVADLKLALNYVRHPSKQKSR